MYKDSIEALHQYWDSLVQEACLSSLTWVQRNEVTKEVVVIILLIIIIIIITESCHKDDKTLHQKVAVA